MKRCGGLIILQTLEDGTIDDDFMVLDFPTHHAKCVIDGMMVNVDFGKPLRGSGWNPFLLLIVIKHDGSTSSGD